MNPHFIEQGNNNISCLQKIKTRVIINPKSVTDTKTNIERLLFEHLDPRFAFDIFYTNSPKHALSLSKEAVLLT